MTNRIALPLTVFLASFLSCAATAQRAQPNPKLQIISGLPIVDCVYINGKGPFRFLLDTGEQSNEMDPDLARKLGIEITFQTELDTPAGASRVPGATASLVSVGNVDAANQEFLITNREALRSLSPDIRGTIGQQFLSKFNYTLDFRHHRVVFEDPAPAVGTRVAFRLVAGCMVVTTDLGDLMLDSGTDSLFLFHASPRVTSAVLSTSNGNIAVALDHAASLRVGGKVYYPSTAAYHPVADAPAAGLMPASLFHTIYVSNSDHYLVFDPN
jgi:hypothetical protein